MNAKVELQGWIENHSKLMSAFTAMNQRSFESWLGAHGVWYDRRQKMKRGVTPNSRTCYLNAWRLRRRLLPRLSGLAYCEGLVFTDKMIMPVWHGWVLDRVSGEVLDPSVEQEGDFAYCGHAFDDDFAHRAWIELQANGFIGIVGNSWLLKSVNVMEYLSSKGAQ